MMKPSTNTLIEISDAYLRASGLQEETTVSYRVFKDTKKIAAMRNGADITVGRFNSAINWFVENWPAGAVMPVALSQYFPLSPEEDAA